MKWFETSEEWETAPISPTCEVMMNERFCDLPTTHVYPTAGGGWMALCYKHAQKHLPNGVIPVALVFAPGWAARDNRGR